MTAPSKPKSPPRAGLSRRRLLGGALTAALAALALPARDQALTPRPDRWKGKTRWIGHA